MSTTLFPVWVVLRPGGRVFWGKVFYSHADATSWMVNGWKAATAKKLPRGLNPVFLALAAGGRVMECELVPISETTEYGASGAAE